MIISAYLENLLRQSFLGVLHTYMEVSRNLGSFSGPYSKDDSVWWTMLGFPEFLEDLTNPSAALWPSCLASISPLFLKFTAWAAYGSRIHKTPTLPSRTDTPRLSSSSSPSEAFSKLRVSTRMIRNTTHLRGTISPKP